MSIMKNYMNDFQQTSKTIIFERFSKEDQEGNTVDDLYLILNKYENVKSDKCFYEIEEKLSVNSFEKFVEKFIPVIYEQVYSDVETGKIRVSYTTEKPKDWDEEKNPVALNMQEFYRMIERLYCNRKNSGQANIEFNFDNISKLLCPKEKQEEYKKLRRQLSYYTREYYRLEELMPGIDSAEKEKCIDLIEDSRLSFSSLYQAGVSEVLSLQLADAENFLLEMKKNDCGSAEESTSFVKALPMFDDDGNLKIVPVKANEDMAKQIELKEDPELLLLETLKGDFEEAAPELAKSTEITNLVLSTVSSQYQRREMTFDEAKKRVEESQALYKEWHEALAKVIAPLVEKFLGVRVFFENAGGKGSNLEIESKVIISNCDADELMRDCKLKLEEFLEHQSASQENRIWFGVIPAVALGNETTENLKPQKRTPFGSLSAISEKSERKVEGLVSSDNARELLMVCEKAKIICFYNFKANENTCFSNLSKDTFRQMRDKIKFENGSGSYAVCCLPNFTVLPKEKAKVIINQELQKNGLAKELVEIKLPGIYIDSAYVSCGMTVGCQNHSILKEKGFTVDKNLPGIRVDFEDKEVAYGFTSNMCRERLLSCPKDLDSEIMESRFGFYFCDTKIIGKDGSLIPYCYVRNARTMKLKGTKYRKLNHVLFADFIELCISRGNSEVDVEQISNFIKKDVGAWKKQRQGQEQEDKKYVNRLLREAEEIEPSGVSGIEIQYGEDRDYVKVNVEEK